MRRASWWHDAHSVQRVLLETCARCGGPLTLRATGSRSTCPHCGQKIRFLGDFQVLFGDSNGQTVERWELPIAVEVLDADWVRRQAELVVRRGEHAFTPYPVAALQGIGLLMLGLSTVDRTQRQAWPLAPLYFAGAALILALALRSALAWRRLWREHADFVARRRALLVEAGLLEHG